VEENKQAAELLRFSNLKRGRHPMQVKTGTAKGTENLDRRASNSWHTAQHAAIYISLGLAGVFSPVANPALAASDVVISQVYGGGGGSGAPFKQDFIELFNRGSTPISLSGWTVQYASATGNTWQVTSLSGTLAPGRYLLIELARGNRGSVDLPAPDVKGSLSLASKSGKVALVDNTTALTCGTPCLPHPHILDLVGYGRTRSFEGTGAASLLSTTTAALRKDDGCTDTDNNGADFATGVPTPRNRASPSHLCTPSSAMHIHAIQGTGHLSPFKDQAVSAVEGIVTATHSKGFYMQDPLPDADPATSEGIFVFTSSSPPVNMGDRVVISGTVREFRPGGEGGTNNLTITEIASPTVQVIAPGTALPAPVVIGIGGRVPPVKVIEDDSTGSVETSGTFDVDTDGIDFYESLEGMRVQINNAVAVGPTAKFGEMPVIGDLGANATTRTVRGGIVVALDDFNPERILLDNALTPLPQVNVGDRFARVEGILDYSFGNFKLLVTAPLTPTPGGLMPETTADATAIQLSVASFNVENLDPQDAPDKFRRLAEQIVHNLKSPDILGLMEVQDNNGAVNDSVVDASVTFNRLISAIQTVGGPGYQFRSIGSGR
jgi:predicted extracellular nuclease